MARPQTPHSKGIRLRNFVQIREATDEELGAVWNQTKTPKQALDDAVERGNRPLRQLHRFCYSPAA
ncbi:MAG TPA: hypothetical protein VMC81_11660 [Rhodocyclaceae bacterium]|nr:hypothetical protein [Rhodocyclaceae bacterium]